MEKKKKAYAVKTKFVFEGEFYIKAASKAQERLVDKEIDRVLKITENNKQTDLFK